MCFTISILAEANNCIFLGSPFCFGDRNISEANALVQSIGRIYRCTQQKDCYVTILENSERIHFFLTLFTKILTNFLKKMHNLYFFPIFS